MKVDTQDDMKSHRRRLHQAITIPAALTAVLETVISTFSEMTSEEHLEIPLKPCSSHP